MKAFRLLIGITVSLFLLPLLALGQIVIHFGQGPTGLWPNELHNDGDSFTYSTCNPSSASNYCSIEVNNVTATLSVPSSSDMPSGWSAVATNSNTLKFSLSNAQPGNLVIPYSVPGQSGSVTLHFFNPNQVSIAFTSTPALGANQTGTFNASVNPSNAYTITTWTGTGGLSLQANGDLSRIVSTGQAGGLLTFHIDDVYGCGYNTTISTVVGPPYIDHTTVNGSNGTTATVPYVATLYLETYGTATGANWAITNGSGSISPSGTTCNAYPSNFLRVVGTPTNSNGSGPDATFYIFKDGYSGYRMAYPNPTKNTLTIDFDDALMAQELVKEVALYNQTGQAVKQLDPSDSKTYFKQNRSVVFDVRDLPKDTYFLHVQMGDKITKNQIVVE